MATLQDHFWRHVLGAATKRVSDFSGVHSTFGETKICNLDMTIMVNQEIFWFKISINDILLMKVHQAIHDFNEIEPGVFLTHSLDGFEVVEKLSTGTVVENKTDKIVGLETVIKLDNKGVVEH